MFTNKEINTFIGLFFAASHSSSVNPVQYHEEFTDALAAYFKAFPNCDETEEPYIFAEFPIDEE